VTTNGQILTVTSATGAEGLQLYYAGSASANISLDYTVGVGSLMYDAVDSMLDSVNGSVENEIGALTDQNTTTQTRVDNMLARLERQRVSLLDRFLAMETALTAMKNILSRSRPSGDVATEQLI
jgi:flagellar hook-associated protein 2